MRLSSKLPTKSVFYGIFSQNLSIINFMIITVIRTFIVFIILAVVMRLMGKRQIGEMQPFEFIVTLIIADLACIPMTDLSIPLIYGVTAVLTLFLLHQILSLLEQTGNSAKKIISGTPSVVIDKNGVNFNELQKNNMGVEDLIESMRAQGYFSLDDLDYAIFESNGKLSAFESGGQTEKPASLPLLIVNKGKIIAKNLIPLKESSERIESFIKSVGGTLKSTEILTVDGNGRTYYKKRREKFRILWQAG